MKFEELTYIKTLRVPRSSVKFTYKTHIWCTLPYPGHPKGCPNYNKNLLCPPNTKFMSEYLQNYNYFYLIYAIFDLFKYKRNMLKKHPNWSDRQAGCLLYWQNSVKKLLKEFILKIYLNNPNHSLYLFTSGSGFTNPKLKQENVYSMEAVGINVIRTLIKNGINIEIKPKKLVHIVNLLCSDKLIKINNKRI